MMEMPFSIDDKKCNQSIEYKDSLEGNDSKEMDDPADIYRCNMDAKFEHDSMDNFHIKKDANQFPSLFPTMFGEYLFIF